jgi:hypothetical protein
VNPTTIIVKKMTPLTPKSFNIGFIYEDIVKFITSNKSKPSSNSGLKKLGKSAATDEPFNKEISLLITRLSKLRILKNP